MSKRKNTKTPSITTTEKHDEFLEQFRYQDDRASVILAAALIDIHLGALLKKAFLPPLSKKDALLDERGIIGTLYSRNHLCLRLGLIDEEMFKAIDVFRDIRNKYAHQLEYCDLSTEPYLSKITQVYRMISWYEPFVSTAARAFGSTNVGLVQFKAVAALVVTRLKQAVDDFISSTPAQPKTLISTKWEYVRMGIKAQGGDA